MTIQTQKDIEHHTKLLIKAVKNGDFETVKMIIPVSDPKASDSGALRIAADKGYSELIKLLIPVSDAKARNSEALRCAAYRKHNECIKLLLPVSDYFIAEEYMKKGCLDTAFLRQHIEEYEAFLQKEHLIHQLNSNVDHIQLSSVKRKM